MSEPTSGTNLLNFEPAVSTFLEEVLQGMSRTPRHLPCKYFYDERGSQLFDEICELDEYYLTRVELSIMEAYAAEMAEQIGPGVMLVEYGSGSSVKSRLLLDHLEDPAAYVPVDISREHLQASADRLSASYDHIEVLPVCADFTEQFELPISTRKTTHAAVYFPGSTIGNFEPAEVSRMLTGIARLCGRGGGLLIGIDLQKERDVIEAAYDDARGVTAEFNLNLLHRINRELDADFDVPQFDHQARYNQDLGRVEISVISQCEQVVTVGDSCFALVEDEEIRTEHSHKYTIEGFAELAAEAGLTMHRYWTDDDRRFAVVHFVVAE